MFEVKIKGNTAYVYTPYNGEFVKAVKNIGGAKWSSENRCWKIPVDAVEACRTIMRQVYGRCDLEEGSRMLRVKLTFAEEYCSYCSDVIILGKVICHAFGRDTGGRAGDDVAYLSGSPESGGSARNWCSTVHKGSVVILANVPELLYNSFDTSSIKG